MKRNLIELFKNYRESECDVSFSELFKEFDPLIKSIARDFTKGRTLPYEEMYSQLCEDFWKTLLKFNDKEGTDLKGFITYRLKQKAVHFTRGGNNTYYQRITYFSNQTCNDEDDEYEMEIASDFNVEDIVLQKKKADQRQLIDSLTKGADDLTTAIVNEVLNDDGLSPKINYAEVARKLNLNHRSVVYRNLEKLASKFDSKQYGNHTDYLAAI